MNNDYTLLALQRFMTLQEEQNQAEVARWLPTTTTSG